jgi:hypothetical protein
VCHAEGAGLERRIVQDVSRAWRFKSSALSDLRGVVEQIVRIVTDYGCAEVTGDRFAKGWVREAFEAHGIRYRDAVRPDGRPLTKAEAYLECEAYFAEGRIALLDDPTQTAELKGLQRRPVPGGRTMVDHRSGAHDDAANALCLAAALVMAPSAVSAGVLIRRDPAPAPAVGAMARLETLRRAMRARPRVTRLG